MNGRRFGLVARVVIAVSLCLLLGAVLFAEQQPAPTPKYTQVKYSADDSSYKWDGDNKILALKGNVKFVHGDTTMSADRVDYDESTHTAIGTGNLKISNDESSLTGDRCTLSFKDKKASVTGNIILITKPKAKGSKDGKSASQLKDETTITCTSIDYFYKDKKCSIPTPVVIVQNSRRITADSATYLGNDDKVVLVGHVKAADSKDGHSFGSPKVTISLKDSDQWMEAEKASGTFFIKDDEEEKKPGQPSEKSPEKPVETSKDKPGK